jgi:hypothetical protein
MIWVGLALLAVTACSLWRTWTCDDSDPTAGCGVSPLDWFDLF